LAGRTRPRDLSDVVKFQRRYVMPHKNVVNCLWTKAFGQFCRSHGDDPVSWSVLGLDSDRVFEFFLRQTVFSQEVDVLQVAADPWATAF
jgi:hypothetical protein